MTLTSMKPPTAHLPSIGRVKSSSVAELLSAVRFLARIYNPEIRGSLSIERRPCPLVPEVSPDSSHDSSLASKSGCQESDHDLSAIRADTFEKSHTIRWLTALVSQSELLEGDSVEWEPVIREAASLLAICAGAASAGTRSRVFAFSGRSDSGLSDIKVQITDIPLDNQDYTSVGAQTWGGACLLADMIVQCPTDFGLSLATLQSVRILELGSGTGLVGLAVARLLDSCRRQAEVVMTDFHPSVLENLAKNLSDNFPSDLDRSLSISSHFLDWANPPISPVPPFDQPFDVIYGADIVYELDHAVWIKTCIAKFLRQPSTQSLEHPNHPRVHLVIPLRSTHAAESHTVEQVFPFASDVCPANQAQSDTCRILAITGKETVVCEDVVWSDGRRAIEYVHYVISWL